MIRPEDYWLMEPKNEDSYNKKVSDGESCAARSKVVVLAIARNAMPHLENTLLLIDELVARFKDAAMYVFENDSTDGTDSFLDAFSCSRPWMTVEHATFQRPDLRGYEPERTVALAEYRNRCRLWAEANHPDADYVVVVDMDPHGGFSVDGVMNSIGWLSEYQGRSCRPVGVGGMASYSLLVERNGDKVVGVAHYDAYAARLNWWDDRREQMGNIWLHSLLFPAASEPVQFNSAFGGLAIYRGEAFLAPGVHYSGGDCEHVGLHKTMRAAGYALWLNPGSRYGAVFHDVVEA